MKVRIITEIIITIMFIITIPIAMILSKNVSSDVKDNENAIQYLQKAEELFRQGRAKYNDASVHYWNALKLNPQLADAHFRLAEIYYDYIWNYEALNELQKLEKINPKYKGLYLLLGKLYHRMAEIDKAFQAFQTSIALEPQNPESYYYLGTIYQQRNNNDDAIKSYNQAIMSPVTESSKEPIVKSYLQLARVYKSEKDLDKAIEFLKRALLVDSESADVISELTVLYSQKADQYKLQQKFDEAAKIYEEIVKLSPNSTENIQYYMELGSIYKGKGLYDKAISMYEAVKKLDPLNFDAFTSIKEIEMIKSGKVRVQE
ncbi:MAG: tetratricopeptide repeat protein [Candidatus Poribacteria bacterium]